MLHSSLGIRWHLKLKWGEFSSFKRYASRDIAWPLMLTKLLGFMRCCVKNFGVMLSKNSSGLAMFIAG